MIIQPQSSGSINISGDSHQNGLDNYVTELNNQNLMQVRRPNEDQILAFIDYQALKVDRVKQHKTVPDKVKDDKSIGSKSSRQVRRNSADQSEDSPLKQSLRDELIPFDSPNFELKKLGDTEEHRKSKTVISPVVQSSKSPKRKTKHFSKIFSKLQIECIWQENLYKNEIVISFSRKVNKQQMQIIQDLSSDINNPNEKCINQSFIKMHDPVKSKKKLQRINSLQAFTALKSYFNVCKLQVFLNKIKNDTIDPQGNFLFFWELVKFLQHYRLYFNCQYKFVLI